jgi:hypothetical protein
MPIACSLRKERKKVSCNMIVFTYESQGLLMLWFQNFVSKKHFPHVSHPSGRLEGA